MTSQPLISAAFLATFAFAAFVAYRLTPHMIRLSVRTGMLDKPAGRKMHDNPMPVLGGTTIFFSFWLTVFAILCSAVIVKRHDAAPARLAQMIDGALMLSPKIFIVFFGSAIIWITGLVDDKFNLRPAVKMLAQTASAVLLISAGIEIDLLARLGPVGHTITLVWILMIINAFNFIDSIDGHCAGVALMSTVIFFCLFQIIAQPLVAFLVIALCGSLLGFLPHNFRPAKIFLGDNGSLFIGYMLAAVTLLASYNSPESRVTHLIPLLMFGVPIYDTVSVVLVRLLRGTPPWKGDRNHFAHRLKRLGMNDKVAVTFSIFVTGALGLIAILSTQIDTWMGNLLILLLFFSFIGIIAFLEYYSAVRISVADDLAKQNRRRREDIRTEEENRF